MEEIKKETDGFLLVITSDKEKGIVVFDLFDKKISVLHSWAVEGKLTPVLKDNWIP